MSKLLDACLIMRIIIFRKYQTSDPRIEKVKEKKRIQGLGTVGNSEISYVKLFL